MTTTQAEATTHVATAQRLSARFGSVFETFDPGDLFTPDAFFDLNMPVWRFQIEGPAEFAAQLKRVAGGCKVRLDLLRTVPTVSGFVHEHQEWGEIDGKVLSARRLWLCEVRAGQIAEVVGYCSGEWDEALRARHALEAPMVRP